jgi:hypothetical protein
LLLAQVAKGQNLAFVHFGMSLFFESYGMYKYPKGVNLKTTKAMVIHHKSTAAFLREKTLEVNKLEADGDFRCVRATPTNTRGALARRNSPVPHLSALAQHTMCTHDTRC